MTQTDIRDLLADAAAGPGRIRFLPSEPDWVPVGAIFRAAEQRITHLAELAGQRQSIAMVLTPSSACLAALFGAWLGGVQVVSCPAPGRAQDLHDYVRHLEHLCSTAGAITLLLGAEHRGIAPSSEIRTVGYDDIRSVRQTEKRTDNARLIQCTSGTTAEPRGVVLSPAALGNNVLSILERLHPRRSDAACSWLPLSHDMGLVGMCLASFAASAAPWQSAGGVTLIESDFFARNPSVWLETCSTAGVTITCAPDFGLRLAERSARRTPVRDLSRIRALITGAELVRAETLRGFEESFRSAGFRGEALCPAYGLAEAALGISMVLPEARWRSIVRPADGECAEGSEAPRGTRPAEVVSCGPPLAGWRARIDEAHDGEILVTGNSLMCGYLGETPRTRAWFRTNDCGFIEGGELFPLGRLDDVIVFGGRKFSAQRIARVVEAIDGVRAGYVAVISVGGDRPTIVFEQRMAADRNALEREIRRQVMRKIGLQPGKVLALAPGCFPKTSSGKPRLHSMRALLTESS